MRKETIIRENGSKRVMHHFDDPSLTRQEFAEECDLGKIIARFSKTPDGMRQLEMARGFVSDRFEDVSGFVDFRTALDQVRAADEAFMGLPPIVRTRFDNDPAKFLDFVDDPKNLDELIKLGLAKGKKEAPEAGANAP
jgi:phage internal scaffolding protein